MTDKKTGDSQDVLEDLDRNSKINTVIDKMGNKATDPAFNQQANVERRRYAPRRQHFLNEGPTPRDRPRE